MPAGLRISGQVLAVLALVAMNAPGNLARSGCRCCSASTAKARAAAYNSAGPSAGRLPPCCCGKSASSADSHRAIKSADHPGPEGPHNCSKPCTALCCAGQTNYQLATHSLVELPSLEPRGLIPSQRSDRPAAPFIDGLLRPPRA